MTMYRTSRLVGDSSDDSTLEVQTMRIKLKPGWRRLVRIVVLATLVVVAIFVVALAVGAGAR